MALYIRSRLLLGRPRVRFSHAADASGTAPQIYDGYQSVSPLPSGFLDRQPIYQLYTLLNRAILFGGQHLVTAQQALDDVLMEKMR